MKKSTLLPFLTCTLALLFSTSCQKKSGNMWDDNQTVGSKYSRQNADGLWGNALESSDSLEAPTEDFIALNDEDLKAQFADGAVPQPSRDLGEGGLPNANQFQTPTGELASILRPVFFNTDDHILRGKESLSHIQKIANYLTAHPNIYVVVEGYCDERGGEAYNLSLGARRANYVRSLLVKQGVNPDQLHTVSLGKEHPFVLGHNPDAWAQNRRAHFRVHQK